MPLTLTILSAAVPAERRGLALGAWGAIAGLAIALGPLVGGAIVEGANWHWIFWLNVPIGLVVIPLGAVRLQETRGPSGRLDLPGLALASGGLLGIVYGLIRGNPMGWTSPVVLGSLGVGVALLAAFVAWERRAPAPMLPLRFFRNRAFALANVASLLMYFGMFGSIFLLSQFLQTVQGYSPVRGRAADPALDHRADLRRADRRRPVRPDRRRAADGPRPGAPGDRPGVARRGHHADGAVRQRRRARSSSPASAWACSSPRSPTSS